VNSQSHLTPNLTGVLGPPREQGLDPEPLPYEEDYSTTLQPRPTHGPYRSICRCGCNCPACSLNMVCLFCGTPKRPT
jgi:hypothetical protein